MAVCSGSSISKERKCLRLSLGKIVVVDEEEIENAKKPMVPKNTRKATDWAVGVFKQWIEQHNAIEKYHTYCLQHFLNESRPPDNHVRICDPSNPHFKQVHVVLDRLFRELHSKGIGARKHKRHGI